MPVIYDLVGRTFGRLTVKSLAPTKKARRQWQCVCECGESTRVDTNFLMSGHTRSCGCLQSEMTRERSRTHGRALRGARTRGYVAWINMRSRCTNPNVDNYSSYGGRGIKVCERWDSFENFLADMGEPPPGKTLDRRDNNGDYSPGNCRWRRPDQQNRNRRDNVNLTARGKTMVITEWERVPGAFSRQTIRRRLAAGLAHEEAIFKPL